MTRAVRRGTDTDGDTAMLTKRQLDLLTFIDERINATGVCPSFDEMKEALDLKSKSAIHRLIMSLEERGYVRRLRYRARALEVLRKPATGDAAGSFTPRVIDGSGMHGERVAEARPQAAAVSVPFYGKIAAGMPIEALRDQSRTFEMPADLLGRGDHYALEIKGDSMIEAGILDGDVALIRQTDTAENGDIVVALVQDREATLKRFRRRGASIALEPANKDHETRIFGPDQIRVQGRLVGLVRKY